jgi:hypothetical protein
MQSWRRLFCIFGLVLPAASLLGQRVPVTLEVEIRVPSQNPDTIRLATEAFRGDGSQAVMFRPAGTEDVSSWEIVDTLARTMTFVLSQIQAATIHPVRRSVVARLARVYEHCEEAHILPGMVVRCEPAGQTAFGRQLSRVIIEPAEDNSGSGMRREMLVIPSLNFLPIEERIWMRGKLTREKRTTSLKVGDPDPALFQVPAHFRVVEKVSELMRLFHVSMRLPINDAQLKMLDVKWEQEKAAVLRGE